MGLKTSELFGESIQRGRTACDGFKKVALRAPGRARVAGHMVSHALGNLFHEEDLLLVAPVGHPEKKEASPACRDKTC
jgi:hypothetical protein